MVSLDQSCRPVMPVRLNPNRPKCFRAWYRIRNWREYEAGLKRRGDLTLWLDETAIAGWHAPRRGRVARIRGAGALTPTPYDSRDTDVGRASQLQHAVEHVDRHVHFGRPTLIRARAQPVPDHALVAADRRLSPGPFHVPG